MNTPHVGSKRMLRPSKFSLGRSACEVGIIGHAVLAGTSNIGGGRLALHACCLMQACKQATHLESILQREQLLRNDTQHLHINPIELIKASPSTLHSPTVSVLNGEDNRTMRQAAALSPMAHRLRQPREEASKQAEIDVRAAIVHNAVYTHGAAEVLACLRLACPGRAWTAAGRVSWEQSTEKDDQPKPGTGCGTPLAAPPSFRCSAPVNVMKQRLTRGVHIKRGGAPRYSYPYAKRDATCTTPCLLQHQIGFVTALKLSSRSLLGRSTTVAAEMYLGYEDLINHI